MCRGVDANPVFPDTIGTVLPAYVAEVRSHWGETINADIDIRALLRAIVERPTIPASHRRPWSNTAGLQDRAGT